MPDSPRYMPDTLLELDHATVVRGQVSVLHALNLRIAQGQHTAILGPNGCGKSSLIKLITRELYPLVHGDGRPAVKVMGHSRWQVERLRSQLGIVSSDWEQNLAAQSGLDVRSTVISGFFAGQVIPPHRSLDRQMLEQADQTLEQVGAQHLAERAFAELSAGQKRRVLIARALVHCPQALLLDEPTTGLDIVARQQLLLTLSRLAQQGITIVLVTHHVEEIIPEIERVVLLRAGRIVADGPCDHVLCDAALSHAFDAPLQVHRQAGQRIIRLSPEC